MQNVTTPLNFSYLLVGPEAARNTVIFIGGTSNIVVPGGAVDRNEGRDPFLAVLEALKIPFFDPQIHVKTHGHNWTDADGDAEITARAVAKLTVYELSAKSFGGVTMQEIIQDAYRGKPLWLILSEETPTYNPVCGPEPTDPEAVAFVKEVKKAGNAMRKWLIKFLASKNPDGSPTFPNVKVFLKPSAETFETEVKNFFNR